ncbi:MAG: hypothetical protein BWY15_02045 [Firmicutes bacterium ADurb.Bin193]|nr:MAG: hypothetical protein BWY15_02045 [Firmicutes bacterium ADurb.Bin193]
MARVLEELYYGNIDPNAKSFQPGSSFQKAMQTVSDNEEKLLLLLMGKEKDLFIDLINAQSEILGITSLETFIEGFRLGARFGIEMTEKPDSCFVDICE